MSDKFKEIVQWTVLDIYLYIYIYTYVWGIYVESGKLHMGDTPLSAYCAQK